MEIMMMANSLRFWSVGEPAVQVVCFPSRRQQSHPCYWATEDPGAAAIRCLHQLATAIQPHMVT